MEKYNLSFAIDNDKLFIDTDEFDTFNRLVSLLKKKEKVEPKPTFDPDLCVEYLFCLKDVIEDIFKEFNLEFKVLASQTFLEVQLKVERLSLATQLELNNLKIFTTFCRIEPLVEGYALIEIPDYTFKCFKHMSDVIQKFNVTSKITRDSYIYEIQDKPTFILLVHDFLKVISEV